MLDGISGPLGWSLAWGFGPDHQLTSFTDANGHETTYSYGNALELTALTYPDGSGFSDSGPTENPYSYQAKHAPLLVESKHETASPSVVAMLAKKKCQNELSWEGGTMSLAPCRSRIGDSSG